MTESATIEHHRMPRGQFEEIAQGGGGADAIQLLVTAQHSKHMILLASVAQRAPEDNRIAKSGYKLLARVQQQDRTAANTVISHPSVGAWALHTLRDSQAVPGATPDGLASVAAAAAIKAGIDAEIEVPVIGGTVMLPSLGAADIGGGTAVVRTKTAEIRSGDRCVTARPGAPGWQEIRSAQGGIPGVIIDDLDPFRMPANDGQPTRRLTTAEFAEFTTSLRDAWDVLLPASAAEIAAIVKVIVPYQAPDSGIVSTSSPQSFGTVAMSRQPDKYTCAETLIHETHHLKLCALLDLVALTKPDDGQRYYAPWRPDPRPASGLLQGAYAFLAVSGFWRGQRQVAPELAVRQRAQENFARWRDGAARVTGTLLSSGQLTPAGHDFASQMARVLDAWQREPVPSEALRHAQHEAERHLAQWRTDNA